MYWKWNENDVSCRKFNCVTVVTCFIGIYLAQTPEKLKINFVHNIFALSWSLSLIHRLQWVEILDLWVQILFFVIWLWEIQELVIKKSSILRINSFQRKDFFFIDFIFKCATSLKGAVQLLFLNWHFVYPLLLIC